MKELSVQHTLCHLNLTDISSASKTEGAVDTLDSGKVEMETEGGKVTGGAAPS